MFTNITEAVDWICSQRRNENSFESFKAVMNELGNPQNDFYMVHVAGTDGKGSTVAYLRDLFMSQGFKVGTLQSPHYLVHQDRIRVNNVNIKDEAFLRILNKYLEFFKEKKLGMFEMDYIIMCEYFKEEKIDIAVVEVGLGGRLDSTNVVDNTKLSVITTIGYDHMDRLGNTLEEICHEKCGIIKKDSKVVIGELNDSCKAIVKETAESRNSEFFKIKKYKELSERHFEYEGNEYSIESFAKYQYHNASLALEAFEIISKDYPFVIDRAKAKEAINKTVWQGRFEIVHHNPTIILDGAHNIHGVSALAESYDALKGSKLIVFSALKRKEYAKMVLELKKHCDKLIVTSFDNYEAIELDDLKDVEKSSDYMKTINDNLHKYDNILICGSLYFISEVVTRINEIKEVKKTDSARILNMPKADYDMLVRDEYEDKMNQ